MLVNETIWREVWFVWHVSNSVTDETGFKSWKQHNPNPLWHLHTVPLFVVRIIWSNICTKKDFLYVTLFYRNTCGSSMSISWHSLQSSLGEDRLRDQYSTFSNCKYLWGFLCFFLVLFCFLSLIVHCFNDLNFYCKWIYRSQISFFQSPSLQP